MDRFHQLLTAHSSRRRLMRQSAMAGGGMAAFAWGMRRGAQAAPTRPAASQRQRFQGETLTVAYMESGTYDAAARAIAEEFTAAHGATVEVVAFPYQNLHDNLATDLVTGTGAYDVISVAYQWDGEFAPYVTPLDDMVAASGIKAEDFIENQWNLSGLWAGARTGIPMANDAMGILYRPSLLEAAGVEPATSWENYNEIAAPLTTDGVYGASWVGLGEQLQGSWISRYWEQGVALCDENWRPLFNNAEGVHAIELLREALAFAPEGMPGWGIPEQKNAVLNGELAQGELWPSFIRADVRNPELSKIVDDWALMPFPGPSELSAWNLAIPQTTSNPELAWEWIKMYTSPENARRFAAEFGIGSPQVATWSDPDLLADYPEYPMILAAIEAGRPIWRIPQFPAAWDVLQKQLEQTVYQDADPQATLDAIAAEWNKLLDSNPPTAPYVE